jgi:DNA-directed RNA polymerase subunit beta'
MPAANILRDTTTDSAAVRIGLASPEDVRRWSFGEVTRGETINYRTARPVAGGLFCERIFGPEKDWECSCGKYRGMKYRGMTCDRCGVQVGPSRVRRKRMGHIELAVPVVHVWFYRLAPSCLAHLFDLKARDLERVIYYQDHIVLDPGPTPLARLQLLDDQELRQARARFGDVFEAGTGAEAVQTMLERLDLVALSRRLHEQLGGLAHRTNAPAERQRKLTHRLKVVDALLRSGNRPEWMVLHCLPVLPPDLRPIVPLPSGSFASSDLNDLYRRIIQRNSRLAKLLDLHAPEVILRNEKRMLQQAVDALFDNSRCRPPVAGSTRRPLKSLGDMLRGKQGRFRENLLGKRVDYSARSVIVVGPELKLHQCGLPKKIALELYQPFVIRRLRESGLAVSIKRARDMIRAHDERVWDLLEEVMRDHPVLLNRAPTLHRMGIQAFQPVLTEGNAIRLHPLVCKGFNADFDGDQMAVHLPLSVPARTEARVLMMSTNNIFSPANGRPIITPSQDIVLGCYYLTVGAESAIPGKAFHSPTEVVQAHADNKVGLHDPVEVRLRPGKKLVGIVPADQAEGGVGEKPLPVHGRVATTVGRVLFNDSLPEALPFYDLPLTGANLSRIIADAHRILGRGETIALLDRIKEVGFRFATRSGLSFATADLRAPAHKEKVLRATEQAVARVQEQYERGNLSAGERFYRVIDLWTKARDEVGRRLEQALADDRKEDGLALNPIYVMSQSGARGNAEQVRQLAGMRGLMARPSGEIIETPIKSSFREGLSVLEYFSSTHGARKGLADTALKTADSGYLTRKLADVAQNVVVTMHDCGTTQGIVKKLRAHGMAIIGRVARQTVALPGGEVVVREGEMIALEQARRLAERGFESVLVRSPMTCEAPRGVCRLCYGMDRSTGELAELGLAAGILAAQSIGEPATQLTLRTFHFGGAAALTLDGTEQRTREGVRTQDITAGLPRLIELFEAQRPRRAALLAEVTGRVRIGSEAERQRGRDLVFIQPMVGQEHAQTVPTGHKLRVTTGDVVAAGDLLTEGSPAPQDVLRVGGAEAVRTYLLDEAQAVYRSQGIEIDDKHLEIIIAQMLRRVRVRSVGDTDLLPGSVMERHNFQEVNRRLVEFAKVKSPGDSRFQAGQVVSREALAAERARLRQDGGTLPRVAQPHPATCVPLVLGVSRAALQGSSFLAAASFQETSKVLAEAALAGKVDELTGLKENVLLGRLVPAGTGFRSRQS